jgi:hypothetical protein
MKNLAILLGLLITASACGSSSAAAPTTPTFTSLPLVTAASRVNVGEDVTGTLNVHGAENAYELTAASDGVLVVRLNWTPAQGRLQLGLLDQQFANFPDNVSPVVGRLPVSAGLQYRVSVADGAPWDYGDLSLSYVLTTVIE